MERRDTAVISSSCNGDRDTSHPFLCWVHRGSVPVLVNAIGGRNGSRDASDTAVASTSSGGGKRTAAPNIVMRNSAHV